MRNKNTWYKSNSDTAPKIIDKSSSKSVVYVRKNVVLKPSRTLDDGEVIAESYDYDEIAVPREDWYIYEQVMSHASDISDVNDALIELAGMIGG